MKSTVPRAKPPGSSSLRRILCISTSDADANVALRSAIPAMASGFNVNTSQGDFSLIGKEAAAVSAVLSALLLSRLENCDQAVRDEVIRDDEMEAQRVQITGATFGSGPMSEENARRNTQWHVASGHRSGRWRVVRGVSPMHELVGARGRTRLFANMDTAQQKADALNVACAARRFARVVLAYAATTSLEPQP
ncbi:hypothetical protein [Ottowia sp.]|uniref:hypothetical protein n=1 Tax=Ottowia sp. TaxID=1898956 RepID=UPI0025CC1D66|nr:hypothetical protein [Ottowia sp.]MBK6616292.1 hypothetical protein [Ottowia sp.]